MREWAEHGEQRPGQEQRPRAAPAPAGLIERAALAGGNAALARVLARQEEGGQSRPATQSAVVEPVAGAPAWLGQVYVHAGLVPAEDVPAMLREAGMLAISRAMRCEQWISNPVDARRVHLGGRESRARRLDWDAVARQVSPADGTGRGVVRGQSLRQVFYDRRREQLEATFGVWSVDQVLSAAEVAEAGGREDVAGALRDLLFRCNQYAVVETLNVSTSARYQKGDGKTFCNIYAHDFVTAMGGYLPRVWWMPAAWSRIQAGAEIVSPEELRRLRREGESVENVVAPEYGKTVSELNANALNRWMRSEGATFGWREETSMENAQSAANGGQIVILLAANRNPRRSGHITVVLAESPGHQAQRDDNGAVSVPLQSQAGSRNFKYSAESGAPGAGGGKQWWSDRNHVDGAAWIFTGQNQSLLVTPEELGLEGAEE